MCPKIVEKLKAIGEKATDCLSRFAGDSLVEVKQGCKQYVVHLRKMTCKCRKWEMTGIPYAHAHSVILYHRAKPEDYVDNYYIIEMYKKAYDPIIYPVPSEEQWARTRHDVLEQPKSRVTLGRPRKVRVRVLLLMS